MVIQNHLIVSIQMKENRSRYMFSVNIIYLKNAASHLTNKSADFVWSIRNFKRYSANLPSLKVEGSKKNFSLLLASNLHTFSYENY